MQSTRCLKKCLTEKHIDNHNQFLWERKQELLSNLNLDDFEIGIMANIMANRARDLAQTIFETLRLF